MPVTINYTRTLEGETFPFELTGEPKVKESLGRIFAAVEILKMNLGTIYLDFGEPIYFTEYSKKCIEQDPQLNPYKVEKDRLQITNSLGNEIVYTFMR